MESTAIFEVELSVTFIRCPPDSIHMFSVSIRRQEIVHLPLLARGTKGSKRQVQGHIFWLYLFSSMTSWPQVSDAAQHRLWAK